MPTTTQAALAVVALLMPAAAAAAPVALTLGNGGSSLVRLGPVASPSAPQTLSVTDSATGGALTLTDIDFDIGDDGTYTLYGFSAANAGVYVINAATGVATLRNTIPGGVTGVVAAIDFNNQIDALRIVTTDGGNFVYRTGTNDFLTPPTTTPLAYGAADVNALASPDVFANAYRAAIVGDLNPEGGMQFGFDAATDAFVMLANNAGTLTTIAPIGFDVGTVGGFDIFSVGTDAPSLVDTGYALLTDATTGDLGLYAFAVPVTGGQINLTMLRDLTGEGLADLRGLAVIDSDELVAPVPLPAPIALLLGGLAALGVIGRRGVGRA